MAADVPASVNNDVYHRLGDRWYAADDDPVALLRAESRFRTPWVVESLRRHAAGRPASALRVLDVGCGGGFLANELARAGFPTWGLDASRDALEVAGRHDGTRTVRYVHGDALALPFEDASFDAVCLMDFLEHVESPAAVLAETARVLAPGGRWFFHTFNRTRVADWVAIRAVARFVANVPEDLHVHRLFVTPDELRDAASSAGLTLDELFGTRPALDPAGLAHLGRIALTGRVSPAFRFVRTRSLAVGYLGGGARA